MKFAPRDSAARKRATLRFRRGRFAAPAIALGIAAAASPAAAQVTEAWLRYTPVEAYAGQRSTRLTAMGGIEVAVPDEQIPINAYHYGDNPAALLAARDTSVVEIPAAYQEFDDQYYGLTHSAIGRGAGFKSEFRPSRKWAMAAEFNYGSADASRHDLCPAPDDCRFIRDFDMPVAPEDQPVTADRTFGAGIRTPDVNVIYARTFFPRITFGGRFGYRKETENRRLIHPYDLNLDSDAALLAGGAEYLLPIWSDAMRLSAWGQYSDNQVVGTSESPLNSDRYTWDRPTVGFGGALVVHRGDWLEGIVDGRHYSFDGEEIAQVNWAPQFYLNPFPSDNNPENVFRREWSAFLSGLRHNEASTRWMVGLPGKPVHLGLRYAYYRQYEWIRPNEAVIQTVNPLDVKRLGFRFAGGLSLNLPDNQGVVGFETRIAHETRTDYTGRLPEIPMVTHTYNFGAEYRARPDLPVRAGFELLRHDPNSDDNAAPFKGIALTAGLGYFWKTLGSQIDFAYAHNHFRYTPGDPSEEIGFGDAMSLYLRRLF
jgi:hypothetical protein